MSALSRAQRLGTGAAWGIAAGALAAAHFRIDPGPPLVGGAVAGALMSLVRPRTPAFGHPLLGLVAAACGALTLFAPEPTVFVLVPLLAAAISWPWRDEDSPEVPSSLPAPRWALPATVAVGFAVLFFQSASRLWGFGGGCKDLGLFYQTHWLIAHGHAPFNTVMGMHALADHMEFVDYAVAPFLWIHDGPVTLLFVQALVVASAALPAAWLADQLLDSEWAGLAAAGTWLLAPDLHLGVMFDYNPTQLGAAGLLWTAWALVARGPTAALVISALTCLVKEDLCLYVAILALVLGWRGAPARTCVLAGTLALTIFALEMTVVFPHFRAGGFRHWEFEELGETPTESARSAAARPDDAAALLVNHPQKRRALLQPLAATGFLGVADPSSLILQVPNWGERFLSTHRTRWYGYHYGSPAAATAVIGMLLGWHRLRAAERDGRGLPGYVVASALLLGLLPPYRTPGGNPRSDVYVARQPYVSAPDDVETQRQAVAFIGRNPYVTVAAQNHLLPFLANRPRIFMLERALDESVDVIALQMNGGTWPDGRPSWRRRVKAIAATKAYGVVFCQGQSVVLRKGAASLPCPPLDALLARPEPTEE